MKYPTLLLLFLFLKQSTSAQEITSPPVYPKVTGYASIVHPIVTFNNEGSTYNFTTSYVVGFPFGINIVKSEKTGFSFEIVPVLKFERGIDKMNNLLFHPGIFFRFKNNFTLITRLAFETSGRYGVTVVFNKVLIKKELVKYFIAVPVPVRFGNEKTPTVGLWFQVGMSF